MNLLNVTQFMASDRTLLTFPSLGLISLAAVNMCYFYVFEEELNE